MGGGDFYIVVFSGISALSNAIIAWETAKNSGKDLSIDEFNRVIQATEKSFSIPNKLRAVIDPETEDIIWNNIKKAELRLINALRDNSNTQKIKDEAIEYASHVICSELRRITKLNNGLLPDKDLERIWLSHRCINI